MSLKQNLSNSFQRVDVENFNVKKYRNMPQNGVFRGL